MPTTDFPTHLIVGPAAVLAVIAVFALARRAAGRVDASNLMRPPRIFLWIGLFGLVLFGAMTVVSFVVARDDPSARWMTPVLIGFTALALWQVARAIQPHAEITDAGLLFRSFFGRRRLLRWDEIEEIGYAERSRDWIVTTARARQTIPVTASNQPLFAGAVLHLVADEAIARPVRARLEEMARGRPPKAVG